MVSVHSKFTLNVFRNTHHSHQFVMVILGNWRFAFSCLISSHLNGNDLYFQLLGTPIGTKIGLNFSNIFIHMLEEGFLAGVSHRPTVWWRYSEDIFALWPWGVYLLQDFEQFQRIFTRPWNSHTNSLILLSLFWRTDKFKLIFSANLRIHINFWWILVVTLVIYVTSRIVEQFVFVRIVQTWVWPIYVARNLSHYLVCREHS